MCSRVDCSPFNSPRRQKSVKYSNDALNDHLEKELRKSPAKIPAEASKNPYKAETRLTRPHLPLAASPKAIRGK